MVRCSSLLSVFVLAFLFSSCDRSAPSAIKGEISRTTICEKPRLYVVTAEDGIHFLTGNQKMSFDTPEDGVEGTFTFCAFSKVSSNKDASFYFNEKNMTLYVFESRDIIRVVEVKQPKPNEDFGSTVHYSFKSERCGSGKKS